MQYDPDNLILDFADRTLKNLAYIREVASQNPNPKTRNVFEATQLINSMLGLLVFPQQRHLDSIPAIPITDLPRDGWPQVNCIGTSPHRDLRELVRYLRNAIAHCNIEFMNENSEITGLRLWNERSGRRTWDVSLSLDDLDSIATNFVRCLRDCIKADKCQLLGS